MCFRLTSSLLVSQVYPAGARNLLAATHYAAIPGRLGFQTLKDVAGALVTR
jgi:hypothetical protein